MMFTLYKSWVLKISLATKPFFLMIKHLNSPSAWAVVRKPIIDETFQQMA